MAKAEKSAAVIDKTIESGDVRIQAQAFGEPSDPPVLLIMGMMASMLWWPDRFCEELAAQGRYVIRYDNRDTGLSTHYPQGEPTYTFSDMGNDAIAVLDGYGLSSAHLVGMSMGGMIAQEVALRRGERVRTLTLISTSPLGVSGLPPSSDAYARHSEEAEHVDWSNNKAVADFMARDSAALAGTRHKHDAEAMAALIERDMARAPDFASATNHFMLPDEDGDEDLQASQIQVPVLVIHGTADPLFPIGHGEAMAEVVSDGRLHRIAGGGHEIHDEDIEEIVGVILDHTRF